MVNFKKCLTLFLISDLMPRNLPIIKLLVILPKLICFIVMPNIHIIRRLKDYIRGMNS